MSIIKNLLNAFVPVRESRNSFVAGLATVNAELVHNVDGDESTLISVAGSSPVGTLEFTGSVDGTNFFPIPALVMAGTGGTVPVASLALITDTLAATNTLRVYAVRTAQLAKVRVRLSAWTSGSVDIAIRSDSQRSCHPGINDRVSSPLLVTATAAVGVTITATLPAAAGLRHYLDFIKVRRSATAALTASATPVLVTTTNLPGSPVLTFGSDAGGIGLDVEQTLDFGGAGLSATAINTATTIVCPAYAGVIWRITAAYRLGV